MASSSTYAFFHCHYEFQKFPFCCVTLCVLHALQNATLSHSAELKRQVLMVQFLSIFFFLGLLQFLLVFQTFPFFLCHSVRYRMFLRGLDGAKDKLPNSLCICKVIYLNGAETFFEKLVDAQLYNISFEVYGTPKIVTIFTGSFQSSVCTVSHLNLRPRHPTVFLCDPL